MVDSYRFVLHRKCLQDLSALCELFEAVSNLPRAPAIFKPLSRGSSTVHRASKQNCSRGPFTFTPTGRKSKRSPMSHSSNTDIRSIDALDVHCRVQAHGGSGNAILASVILGDDIIAQIARGDASTAG